MTAEAVLTKGTLIETLRFRPSEHFFVQQLALDLYKDHSACMWELCRNGWVACMPDENKWEPKRAHVEIQLLSRHVFSPDAKVLFIMDKGSGITDEKKEKFQVYGKDDQRTAEFAGASQKRLGRFSAFALIDTDRNRPDLHTFYVLTRTADHGPVKRIRVNGSEITTNGSPVVEIPPDAPELGPYRGIKGSFTIVAIPNPVYTTHAEIAEDLRWRLPRSMDRQVTTLIGGERLTPPPLAQQKVTTKDGKAFIEKCEEDEPDSGMWLTDLVTGFRCAKVSNIREMFYVLQDSGLRGDIFIPDLLKNQDTSRSGLSDSFLRSIEWDNHKRQIGTRIVPIAKQLLGQDRTNPFSTTTVAEDFESIVDVCEEIWGAVEYIDGGPLDLRVPPGSKPPGPPRPPPKQPGGGGGGGGGSHPPKGPGCGEIQKGHRKSVILPIDGRRYKMSITPNMPPTLYARVVPCIGIPDVDSQLEINSSYQGYPSSKGAKREHVIASIFLAVACEREKDSSDMAHQLYLGIRLKAKAKL